MNVEQFVSELKLNNVELTDAQLEQFEQYYHLLVEWNEKMDLTTIVERNEVYLKHFFDSLTPSFYVDFSRNLSVCDVGAGAGFPSIPLKICFPQLKLTIVDSLKKRMAFLNHVINMLGLEDIHTFHSRAEDFGQKKKQRESFDLVIARAVARTSVLSELCLPLCKINGLFIAMKGPDVENEIKDANRAIKILGGKIKDKIKLQLPIEKSDRSIVLVKKHKKTPRRYPRQAGIPQREPIV